MQIALYFYLFIIGLFVGSFLNLVSDRLPNGEKFIFGRSKCDFCHKSLKPKNLVPIFSFIIQKGKCSFCHKKLSFLYPLSELMTGVSFLIAGHLSGFVYDPSVQSAVLLLYYIVVFGFFVVIFLTDVKYSLIPDSVIIPAIIFVFLSSVLFRVFDLVNLKRELANDQFGVYLLKTDYLSNHSLYALKEFGIVVLGALIISLFFLFLIFITKGRGMGFGDVKLGFLIGLINGFPFGIFSIFLGFVIGAVYSLLLMAVKKKTMKDTIPFGPFLIIGSVVTLLFGSAIWEWYSNLSAFVI